MEISEEEFVKMKSREQMLVIFKNTNTTAKEVSRFRFHQKVQYLSISALFAMVLWIITKVVA